MFSKYIARILRTNWSRYGLDNLYSKRPDETTLEDLRGGIEGLGAGLQQLAEEIAGLGGRHDALDLSGTLRIDVPDQSSAAKTAGTETDLEQWASGFIAHNPTSVYDGTDVYGGAAAVFKGFVNILPNPNGANPNNPNPGNNIVFKAGDIQVDNIYDTDMNLYTVGGGATTTPATALIYKSSTLTAATSSTTWRKMSLTGAATAEEYAASGSITNSLITVKRAGKFELEYAFQLSRGVTPGSGSQLNAQLGKNASTAGIPGSFITGIDSNWGGNYINVSTIATLAANDTVEIQWHTNNSSNQIFASHPKLKVIQIV